MKLTLNLPLNTTSFGAVSYGLLHEAYKAGHEVYFFPIGPVDMSNCKKDDEFAKWLNEAQKRAIFEHDRNTKCIKLWHMFASDQSGSTYGAYYSPCKETTFLSFYELDSPTQLELNMARNFDMAFTSQYTCDVFAEKGVKTRFVPLFFDKEHFHVTNKKYYADDRIAFFLGGKFEHRKRTQKAIAGWVKRFGDDRRYYLNLAVYNPFFPPQLNQQLVIGSMGGKHYYNVNVMSYIPGNEAYNDLLNANHIVIGASGAESWSLPEFQCVALGKHAVIHNCSGYKEWATEENSVLFQSLNKISSVDNVFFKENGDFNVGSIFDWDEDEFIHGLELAVKRYEESPINTKGLELQEKFTVSNTLNQLINAN
jgi:hypothetical protein